MTTQLEGDGVGVQDSGTDRLGVAWPSYPHEVLGVVLSVRQSQLCVLLWRRRLSPQRGRWALPGGGLSADERLRGAITRHLAVKVDVHEIAHLEQLATHSAVDRDPRGRVLATAYLGLVPSDADSEPPPDTTWQPVDDLPQTAFDHRFFIDAAVERLRAKLSYTNVGFALAPQEFTIAELRDLVSAALGYQVSPTNLTRVMTRRQMIEPTGATSAPGRAGGRPAAVYRFARRELTITDPFAVLKPPR
ncbi:NUDIX domain-containing protein [Jatrophihabitans sp. DSM 44399]|uniref:NUDIX domain-containing protein n=1 Tax=Jatrophihabitans lederbergiae TaxID=3075547 RepID=A0ABU2JCS5_9ACTN|nr:NUDIX domain-containing protein [Jatrophihabitans sp. DSM 44399]MDT0262775.1 NUDIX domain-containing protein [Jatrophihabitans sp. DSM 44399]